MLSQVHLRKTNAIFFFQLWVLDLIQIHTDHVKGDVKPSKGSKGTDGRGKGSGRGEHAHIYFVKTCLHENGLVQPV